MFSDIVIDLVAEVSSGNPLVDFLAQAGALGVLAVGCVAFMKGWIVRGSEVTQLRAERDKAMAFMEDMAKVAAKSLEIAEKKVNP